MPRAVESTTSKLLKLIDDLTPDGIRFAKEILTHAERKPRGKARSAAPIKRKKRTPVGPPDGMGQ